MENAQLHQNAELSALDSLNFKATFPNRHNTVTAEVLQKLLVGETLNCIYTVFSANTTRLGAYIHALKRDYNWVCEHRDMAVGTKDGRVTEIRAYYFATATVRTAMQNGGDKFCASVKAARLSLREKAATAKTEAAKRNARKVAINTDPRQFTLGY
jgi:pyruvoyl-dependent arginine decarboxylase (PvlArgDC)